MSSEQMKGTLMPARGISALLLHSLLEIAGQGVNAAALAWRDALEEQRAESMFDSLLSKRTKY